MDPVQIIITIAACIGALIALYFAFALVIFTVASKKARKTFDDFDGDFFKRNRGF